MSTEPRISAHPLNPDRPGHFGNWRVIHHLPGGSLIEFHYADNAYPDVKARGRLINRSTARPVMEDSRTYRNCVDAVARAEKTD